MKTYYYHATVVSSDKLIDVLNEKGGLGFRTVSVHLDKPHGILVIFEEELIDGARPFPRIS